MIWDHVRLIEDGCTHLATGLYHVSYHCRFKQSSKNSQLFYLSTSFLCMRSTTQLNADVISTMLKSRRYSIILLCSSDKYRYIIEKLLIITKVFIMLHICLLPSTSARSLSRCRSRYPRRSMQVLSAIPALFVSSHI